MPLLTTIPLERRFRARARLGKKGPLRLTPSRSQLEEGRVLARTPVVAMSRLLNALRARAIAWHSCGCGPRVPVSTLSMSERYLNHLLMNRLSTAHQHRHRKYASAKHAR